MPAIKAPPRQPRRSLQGEASLPQDFQGQPVPWPAITSGSFKGVDEVNCRLASSPPGFQYASS